VHSKRHFTQLDINSYSSLRSTLVCVGHYALSFALLAGYVLRFFAVYEEHIGAERAAEEAAEAAVATAKQRVNPEPPTKNVETQLTNTKRQVVTKNGRKVIKPRGWEG